jgi:hypothetical protein
VQSEGELEPGSLALREVAGCAEDARGLGEAGAGEGSHGDVGRGSEEVDAGSWGERDGIGSDDERPRWGSAEVLGEGAEEGGFARAWWPADEGEGGKASRHQAIEASRGRQVEGWNGERLVPAFEAEAEGGGGVSGCSGVSGHGRRDRGSGTRD